MSDHEIRAFTVSISDEAVTEVRSRLANTRWPEQLPGPAWQRGVPVDYLRRVAEYWASEFDWRAQEKRINAYPQFTTDVDGQRIHFLHVRSAVEGATPLLLL
ncbi:MAG TPA: epoxide hydrolase N-terminal domain-containing protein, partial [Propionibacteriaceae bacterium]|nr:epoxide hydrolase N-terminal domain-containing protein [Propionibacteriaceae bacterium]